MKSVEDNSNILSGSINIINIEKLCRLCLIERENLTGIYENNFVNLILLCANIQVGVILFHENIS